MATTLLDRAPESSWPVGVEQSARAHLAAIVSGADSLLGSPALQGDPAEVVVSMKVHAEGALQAIDSIKARFDREARRAEIDGLTGLFNRLAFEEHGPSLLERTRAEGLPVSLLVFDVDHFKTINDTHGHPVGDDVLRAISGRLRRALRPSDLFARIGGEEFAAILPCADADAAGVVAERLREHIAGSPVGTRMAVTIPVTISVGVAGGGGLGLAALMQQADAALYVAKRSGRNQVRVAVTGDGPGGG